MYCVFHSAFEFGMLAPANSWDDWKNSLLPMIVRSEACSVANDNQSTQACFNARYAEASYNLCFAWSAVVVLIVFLKPLRLLATALVLLAFNVICQVAKAVPPSLSAMLWAFCACKLNSLTYNMFTPEAVAALGVLDLRSQTLHHPDGTTSSATAPVNKPASDVAADDGRSTAKAIGTFLGWSGYAVVYVVASMFGIG